jgi:hypothetical protein
VSQQHLKGITKQTSHSETTTVSYLVARIVSRHTLNHTGRLRLEEDIRGWRDVRILAPGDLVGQVDLANAHDGLEPATETRVARANLGTGEQFRRVIEQEVWLMLVVL